MSKDNKNEIEKKLSEEKINETIRTLREIKSQLESASSASEIEALLSKLGQLASEIPSDQMPQDIRFDDVKQVYSDKLHQIYSDELPQNNNLEQIEKPVEQALKELGDMNQAVQTLLDRSYEKNKNWAKNPESMTPQDAKKFADMHKKDKEAELKFTEYFLKMPLDKILKEADKEVERLTALHGSSDHKEVIKFVAKVDKQISSHRDSAVKFAEHLSHKAKTFKRSHTVRKSFGEKEAEAEYKLSENNSAEIRREATQCKRALEKWQARKFANRKQKRIETPKPLSPDPTPRTQNELKKSSKRTI